MLDQYEKGLFGLNFPTQPTSRIVSRVRQSQYVSRQPISLRAETKENLFPPSGTRKAGKGGRRY
jgi:hypothetical protein